MSTYQVQVGDTINSIANRFGVSASMIKGYRSNDPNVILPGETLDIGSPPAPVVSAPVPGVSSPQALGIPAPNTPPAPNATSVVTGKPVYGPDAPAVPAPATQPVVSASTVQPATVTQPKDTQTPQLGLGGGTPAPEQPQDIESLVKGLATSNPELAKQLLTAMGGSTNGSFLTKYGIDPSKVESGFQTSPTTTVSDLVKQVMTATGLPDVTSNISKISGEIESLQNERDDKIRALQDNPFNSAGTKEKQIQLLKDKYEQLIANRTNRLTLMQNAYTQARQEAQFAVTTAIGLYDKNRTFDANQLENYLTHAEKAAAAEAKLNEKDYQVVTLKDEYGNEYTRIFDKKKGVFTSGGQGVDIGGGVTVGGQNGSPLAPGTSPEGVKSLVQVGQILSSSFTSKFQQTQFLKTMNQLAAQGNTQGLAEHIFARAIDTIADSDERKKVNGRYEMVKRLNRIQDLLVAYKDKGGETGLFKGSIQTAKQKLGKLGDPDLASIGTAIANAMDEMVRFRTGAALTVDEQKFYDKIMPSTWNTSALNTATITGLRDSLAYDVDNSLRRQLTSEGYKMVTDALTSTKSPIDQNQAPASSVKVGDTKIINGFPYMKVEGGWKLMASVNKK